MTENNTPDAATPAALGPGALLAAARARSGMSALEAAGKLHLDSFSLDALEADRFEHFGASVFVRGHLRRYADLMGLTHDQVESAYERMAGTGEAVPSLSVSLPPTPRRRQLEPRIAVITAVLVVLIAAAWWASRAPRRAHTAPSAPASTAPAPGAPASSAPAGTAATGTAPVSPAENGPAVDATAAGAAPASTATGAATAPAGASAADPNQVHLRLHFTENSWTEITDVKGHRVFFGLGTAGTTQTVEGRAPLHVMFGNPAGVELSLEGRPVPLGAHAEGSPVRFALDGDGHMLDVPAPHG